MTPTGTGSLCVVSTLEKGVEETRDVLKRRLDDREVQFILSTAAFCGVTKSKDSITKKA